MTFKNKKRDPAFNALAGDFFRMCRWWWQECGLILGFNGAHNHNKQRTAAVDLETGTVHFLYGDNREVVQLKTPYSKQTVNALMFEVGALANEQKISRLAINLPEIIEITVDLPEAARSNLSEFIEYDIDRHVPFQRDEVALIYEYLRHEPSRKLISVKLTLCPLPQVASAQAMANQAGCRLTYLGKHILSRDTGNLAPETLSDSTSLSSKFKWSLAIITFLALLLIPLVHKNHINSTLTQKFKEVQLSVVQQRAALTSLQTNLAWVAPVSVESPRLLDTFTLITEALNGKGWISYLVWRPGELQITGQISNTTEFIQKLATHEGVTAVDYLSPTQSLGEAGLERFQLKLLLKPPTGGQGD